MIQQNKYSNRDEWSLLGAIGIHLTLTLTLILTLLVVIRYICEIIGAMYSYGAQ